MVAAISLWKIISKIIIIVVVVVVMVKAKVVVAKEWGNRVVGCRTEIVKVEELKKQENQDRLKETYDKVKEREAGELGEEWELMKVLWGMRAIVWKEVCWRLYEEG